MGDAILLTYRGERLLTVLSDFSFFRAAEREALASVGGEIDGFLLPYYTEESAAYIKTLLQTQKVYCLYLPVPRATREEAIHEEILAIAKKEGVSTVAFGADVAFDFGEMRVERLHLGTASKRPRFIFLEVTLGDRRIQYYSADALGLSMRESALGADVLIFGTYGGTPDNYFAREDFVSPEARVLCASPTVFPFTRLDDIAFSIRGVAFVAVDEPIS